MSANKSPPSQEDMQLAAAIYERHKGMMVRTAAEHLHDRSLTDDVVHDAVIRLAEYAATLRRLSDGARARYAKETVRSVALNCERQLGIERKYLTGSEPLDEEMSTPEPSLESAYIERDTAVRELRFLHETLDELDETDRALLVGKYLLGESDEQLSQRLGIKPASIRMKLTRARRQARRIMERKEGGRD